MHVSDLGELELLVRINRLLPAAGSTFKGNPTGRDTTVAPRNRLKRSTEASLNTVSFMTANYVARQVGYNMTGGWGQGDRATNDYFRPADTFPERFERILLDVRAAGFDALDLWTGHLNWRWATDEHVATAQDLLHEHALKVSSLAGSFGSTPQEFESACKLAGAMNTDILGGTAPLLYDDRASLTATLQKYGVKLAIENHGEPAPDEVLAKIGDGGGGTIGTTVDTGLYAAEGYDAARAIEKLGRHVMHVHLKDVVAPDDSTSTRYGDGCVPLHRCVQTLQGMDYNGGYSVEHEPADEDPTEDCKAGLRMLHSWLSG